MSTARDYADLLRRIEAAGLTIERTNNHHRVVGPRMAIALPFVVRDDAQVRRIQRQLRSIFGVEL